MKLNVEILFHSRGKGVADAVSGVKALGTQAVSTGREVRALAGQLIALYASSQIIAGMSAMVMKGVQFNSTMDQSRIGIAALLQSFGKIEDAQGRVLKGVEGYHAATKIAVQMQKELQRAAIETTAEYEDLVQALQIAVGPAMQAGFDPKQIVKFTQVTAQAAAAIGLPMVQLGQEIRSLFAGDIGPDSRLANLLFSDIPRNNIKKTVEEMKASGVFYEEMMRRMSAFATAGTDGANTFAGALSNLHDAIGQALGEATRDATDGLTAAIKELTDNIVTFDEAGNATFNQDFVESVKAVADAMAGVAGFLKDIILAFPELITQLEGFKRTADQIKNEYAPFTRTPFTALSEGRWGEGLAGLAGPLGTLAYQQLSSTGIKSPTQNVADIARERDAEVLRETFRQIDPMNTLRRPRNAPSFGSTITNAGWFDAASLAGAPTVGNGDAKSWGQMAMAAQLARADLAVRVSGSETGKGGPSPEEVKRAEKIRKETEVQLAALAAIHTKNREIVEDLRAKEQWQRDLLRIDRERADVLAKIAELTHLSRQQRDDAELTASIARGQQKLAVLFEQAGKVYDSTVKGQVEQAKLVGDATADIIKNVIAEQSEMLDRTKRWGETEAARVRAEIERQRALYAQMGDTVGASLQSGLNEFVRSGETDDALKAFADSFAGYLSQGLAGSMQTLIDWLAKEATGEEIMQKDPNTGEMVGTGKFTGGSKGAQMGFAGLTAVGAAYSIWNQQGASKTQNVIGGMAQGASAGATIGTAFAWAGGQIWGAVIGAVVGAILGAFAPTADKVGFNIGIVGGQIRVSGVGDAKQRQVDQVLRDVNKGLKEAKGSARDILEAFPPAIMENLLDGIGNANMSIDIKRLIGATKSSTDALKDFMNDKLPRGVFDAYSELFKEGLSALGVTDEKIADLFKDFKLTDAKEAFTKLREYVEAIVQLKDQLDFFAEDRATRVERARFLLSATPLERIGKLDERLEQLGKGFEDLTHDEQLDRVKEINDLLAERYEIELRAIHQIVEASKAVTDSLDRQIFDIEQTQRTPEGQIEALLGRQRMLRDMLQGASTAEEIQAIVQEMQQIGNQLYQLMGATPEAATQIIDMLKDIREQAQIRFDALLKSYEDQDKALKERLDGTMDTFLGKVEEITKTIPDKERWKPIEELPGRVHQVNEALDEFRDRLLNGGRNVGGNNVTSAMGASATGSVSVTVNNYGDASAIIAATEVMVNGKIQRVASGLGKASGF